MTRVLKYWRDQGGAAAAEFAMFVVFLAPLILNLVDIGNYAYIRMMVYNAAQAGAQAAYANCGKNPATAANCPNMYNAIQAAVQGTSLGNRVTWSNSSSIWTTDTTTYCPIAATNSIATASASSNCTATGAGPGTYVKVTASFAYTPIFTGATVASLFTTPITTTTYMRLY